MGKIKIKTDFMTIGVDIRVLSRGLRSGVEEYTINLLSHLFLLAPRIKFKLFYNAFQRADLPEEWLGLPNVEIKKFSIPNRFLDFSLKYFKRPKIDKLLGGLDVFFSPHFLITALSANCPRVMTWHDLSFKYFPEFVSLRRKLWHFSINPRAQARKADKIIAVSESTKADLVELYKIPKGKITVIYSGVIGQQTKLTWEQKKALRKKYNLPMRFILYFGTIEPRKNLIGLIKAFEIFKKQTHSSLGLVLAGNKGWLCKKIFQEAAKSPLAKEIIFTGFVEEKDKLGIYQTADLFCYLSFFEGFGFPPLEAMSSGTPVIASNLSSLPEVIGEAGLIVDPYQPAEISWAMRQILENDTLKQDLIKKGLERVQKFSWQKCAQQTLDFLIHDYRH